MKTDITETKDDAPATKAEPAQPSRTYRPLVDIVEADRGVSLMLELPGVGIDDIDISLEKRVLTISGAAGAIRSDGMQLVYSEYSQGNFERSFVLSDDFNPEKIEAEMRNGVLTITLPRAEETRPKKIAVKAA